MSQTTFDFRQLPDNTPILIGAGQYVEHIDGGATPPFTAPMALAAIASRAALADSGSQVAARDIDTIAVVRLFSDSIPAWRCAFGASDNPPESVARRISAQPRHRIVSAAGGSQPLDLLIEMAHAIARGEKSLVLVTGAEAIGYQKYGRRNGYDDDWHESFNADFEDRVVLKRFVAEHELQGGLALPVHYYSLIESCQAHQRQHEPAQQRHYMAQLLAPFSAVAARNPYAQFPRAYTAEQLASSADGNYPITNFYNKKLVAQDAVNQSAAILLCSVSKAKAMGIDPGRWIFLNGFAQGTDHYLSQRPDPGHSAAMQQTIAAAMAMAGIANGQLGLVDIYSCFPSAVTAAADAMKLAPEFALSLTVTGGLPFFGGAGSNYSMHALAEMVMQLRNNPCPGLVTANGGMLSKHAAVVLSNTPVPAAGNLLDWQRSEPVVVSAAASSAMAVCEQPRSGKVVGYSVIHAKQQQNRGIVLAETADKQRFIASSLEPQTVDAMQQSSVINRRIDVEPQQHSGGGHVFTFSKH